MPRRSPRGKPYHKPDPTTRRRERRTTAPGQHVPVLLAEVLAALNPRPGHVVADCTLGFGGHAAELLKFIGPTGKLVATDLDADNLPRAEPRLTAVGHPFVLRHANFGGLGGGARRQGPCDGRQDGQAPVAARALVPGANRAPVEEDRRVGYGGAVSAVPPEVRLGREVAVA